MSRQSLLAVLILILLGTGLHLGTQADTVPVPIPGGAEPPASPADEDPVEDWEPASPRVTGQVLDAEGRPAAGAEVRFTLDRESRLYESLTPEEQREIHRVRSDARGAFQIDALRPGAPYDVLVVQRGYAPLLTAFSLQPVGLTPDLRLVLRPGRTARGMVLDGKGRPVEGVQVWLHRSTRAGIFTDVPFKKVWADSDLFRTFTGPDGRFEIADLPDHPLDLAIWGSTFAPLVRRGILLPADRKVAELGGFRLDPGASIAGRVTDRQGAPIPGAAIGAWGQEEQVTETGRDGRFVIEGLSSDTELHLSVCRPGFETMQSWFAASAPEAARIVLEPAGRIAGRVVDPDGAPVAGAEVRASLDGSGRSWSFPAPPCPPSDFARTKTDARGSFDLTDLAPGPVSLWVMAEGHPKEVLTVEAGGSTRELTVALRPGAVVAGRILDPKGRPVAGAKVSDDDHPSTVSRADGTYRLEGIGMGARNIDVSHPNHAFLSKTVRIEPGENRFDVSLSRVTGRLIRGRVLDPDGEPAAGARVLSNGKVAAATAADGSFAFVVDEGSYTLEAQAGNHAPAAAEVDVWHQSAQGVELRLSRGITLTGRLAGMAPEELATARVSALPKWNGPRNMAWEATLDAEGRYRLEGLFPDEWSLAIYTDRRRLHERFVLAAGARARELDVHLAAAPPPVQEPAGPAEAREPQGITLHGRLLGVEPADLPDVSAEAILGSRWEFATITRFGEYRLSGLSPGTWKVQARHGVDTATGTVRLEPGMEDAELDLTFVRGTLTLSGRIDAPADRPALYLELSWEDGMNQSVYTHADEKGEFRFTRLHPGRYSLTVSDDAGLLPLTRKIEMSADQEVVLHLEGRAAPGQ